MFLSPRTNILLSSLLCSLFCFIPWFQGNTGFIGVSCSCDLSPGLWLDFSFATTIAVTLPVFLQVLIEIALDPLDKKTFYFAHERFYLLISFVLPSAFYFAFRNSSILGFVISCANSVQNIVMCGILGLMLNQSSRRIWSNPVVLSIALSFQFAQVADLFPSFQTRTGRAAQMGMMLFSGALFLFCVGRGAYFYLFRGCVANERFGFIVSLFSLVFLFATFVASFKSSNSAWIYNNCLMNLLAAFVAIVPSRVSESFFSTLEKKLESKASMVRYIGHEVRTPLNIAEIGLALLRNELAAARANTPAIDSLLADIQSGLDSSVATLDEILLIEKLDAGVVAPEKSHQNPLDFLGQQLPQFQVNPSMEVVLPDVEGNEMRSMFANTFIDVDPVKMAQVIRNLVSNALKFTSPTGRIEVVLSRRRGEGPSAAAGHGRRLDVQDNRDDEEEGTVVSRTIAFAAAGSSLESLSCLWPISSQQQSDWLVVEVRDSGCGIDEADLGKLFKGVVQFNANANQKGGGSGIGLMICKGIVELHGGRLFAASEGLGKGCTITLELPLFVDAAPATMTCSPPAISIEVADAECGKDASDSDQPVLIETVKPSQLRKEYTSKVIPVVSSGPKLFSSDLDLEGKVTSSLPWSAEDGRESLLDCGVGFEEPAKPVQSGEKSSSPTAGVAVDAPAALRIGNGLLAGACVLVVDDVPTCLKMVVRLFTSYGARCEQAADGAQAVEAIRRSCWESEP
jgi:signal transduction histidine kinase